MALEKRKRFCGGGPAEIVAHAGLWVGVCYIHCWCEMDADMSPIPIVVPNFVVSSYISLYILFSSSKPAVSLSFGLSKLAGFATALSIIILFLFYDDTVSTQATVLFVIHSYADAFSTPPPPFPSMNPYIVATNIIAQTAFIISTNSQLIHAFMALQLTHTITSIFKP